MSKVVINNDQEIKVVGVGNDQPVKVVKIGPVATTSGAGTVTSVAMTMPTEVFASPVVGSPVTTSGTLAPALKAQAALTVLAGPASGPDATPTFRMLTSADVSVQFEPQREFFIHDPGSGLIQFFRNTDSLALSNGDNNNIPGSTAYYKVTGATADFAITGIDAIVASPGPYDGEEIVYQNATAHNMTIRNMSASSSNSNKILTGTGADIVIGPDQCVTVFSLRNANLAPFAGWMVKSTNVPGGRVDSIVAGANISVDNTDPRNPVVSSSAPGTGTVTNVSVVTANGVSGSVANPTTTPAITLSLGAISPTSVAASGTVTGSNLSGTNTGDQTIALTGDVTGSGTGSFAATIANNAVTLAKIQNATANSKLLGSGAAGVGIPYAEITLGTNLAMVGTTLNATAGGGALVYVTETLDTASPNDTRNNEQLVVTGATTADVDLSWVPRGAGAFQLAITNNAISGGNKRGTYAIDLQLLRGSAATVASGDFAVIGGGQSNTGNGYNSTTGGGYQNTNSANYGFIGGGQLNMVTNVSDYAAIAGGHQNLASAAYTGIISGNQCQATDLHAIAGGNQALAQAETAVAIGSIVTADQPYSIATGFNAHADKWGQHAHASGLIAVQGDAQSSQFVLRTQTVDATVGVILYLDYPAVGHRQMVMADNTAWTYEILVVAKDSASTNSAHWRFAGGVVRGVGAGTIALVGAGETVVLGNTLGGTSAAVVAVDLAAGALAIHVTGNALTGINWTAFVRTSEVTT